MYIIKLSYLEDGFLGFIKFLDGNIKECNKMLIRLIIAAIILKTNNHDLLYLINSKAKQANKKKEKAKRCQQRKINLV